jgi:hypothetical protein
MIIECNRSLGESNEEEESEYQRLLELVRSENTVPSFNPNNPNNVVAQVEKSQERMLMSLEENNIINPRQMSVFQIEIALEKFEEEMAKLKSREKDVSE